MKEFGEGTHVEGDFKFNWSMDPRCKPDPDYSCGAAYCDDPACGAHNRKGKEDWE